MKRKDILKKLVEAGFTLVEGGGHTRVYDQNGVFRSIVGRHVEIPERTVYEIQRQTGVKLKP